jgi:hypothetical protein
MPLSTSSSNSEWKPFALGVAAIVIFVSIWEWCIRIHYNPPLEKIHRTTILNDNSHPFAEQTDANRTWIAFGNCLVMNGVSPKVMLERWREQNTNAQLPRVVNAAEHEFAPQAYLQYLKSVDHFPSVVIANVSGWLNSDNFDVAASELAADNPLGLGTDVAKKPTLVEIETTFQEETEVFLHKKLGEVMRLTHKKHHLFDFSLFLAMLGKSWDLEKSFYQLRMQRWFKLLSEQDDGFGSLAFEVDYGPNWQSGVQTMVDQQLIRARLGYFLTESYWTSLEELIKEFNQYGTRFVMMRMPEHPDIFAFYEKKYGINEKLTKLAENPKVEFVNLNVDEVREQIRLFDAVHPDFLSAKFMSTYLADELVKRQPEWIYGPPAKTTDQIGQ